jgi:hypothetical protein
MHDAKGKIIHLTESGYSGGAPMVAGEIYTTEEIVLLLLA